MRLDGGGWKGATKRFVVPDAGLYMFAVHWATTNAAAVLNTQIRKNGVVDAYALGRQLTHALYLFASDYVEVYIRHAESTSQHIDVSAYTTFVKYTLF